MLKLIKGLSDLAIFGAPPVFEEPLHVGRPNIGDRERLLARINDILDRRWLTNNGPMVQALENRLAEYLGVRHCVAVCNGTVVGFGHPMEFVGKSSYGMAGADALYVQSDSLGSSFKVANIGGILGTVSQDRMTGISGLLGDGPPQFPITSDITCSSGISS